jgi:hypothetical protein
MKSTLIIKDLALDKELGGKAMSAVHGGNSSKIGDQNQFAWIGGNGGGIGNTNTVTQVEVGPTVKMDEVHFNFDSFNEAYSKKPYPVRF